MSQQKLNLDEKIRILLAEYAGLRSHVTARIGHGLQVSGFIVTALSLLATQNVSWKTIIVLFFIFVLFIVTMIIISRDLWKASIRLREIEDKINYYAGEELLIWETQWGERSRWTSAA